MTDPLNTMRCVPCTGAVRPLPRDTVLEYLRRLPAWTTSEDHTRLRRTVATKNFAEALALLNRIGAIAEQEGHHPDLHLVKYRHLTVDLTTNAADGLTDNDFVLAARIDELLPASSPSGVADGGRDAGRTGRQGRP